MNPYGTWLDVWKRFKISRSHQKTLRLSGAWPEGVFWHRISSRKTVLNLDLIGIWVRLRNHPTALEAAIADYQAQLPENQEPYTEETP